MKIKKGDIVEVINIDNITQLNGKIKIGNRYITDSDPYEGGQINIINPENPAYNTLKFGTYILYRKEKP